MMSIVSLSSDGQVIIPGELLATHNWQVGQEWEAVTVADGILLKPRKTFPETTLSQVAGCLKYQGNAKTLEEMEQAIAQNIEA